MEKKYNDIESLFRDQLLNEEVAVPSHVKEGIDSRISRKKYGIWGIFILLLLLIACAGIWGSFELMDSNQHVVMEETSEAHTQEVIMPIHDENTMGNDEIKQDISIEEKQLVVMQEANKHSTELNDPNANKHEHILTTKKKGKLPVTTESGTKKEPSEKNILVETDGETFIENTTIEKTLINPTSSAFEETFNESSLPKNSINNLNRLPMSPITKVSFMHKAPAKMNKIPTIEPIDKPKGYFMVGAEMGAHLYQTTYSQEVLTNSTSTSSSVFTKPSASIDLTGNYYFPTKMEWGIGTGIGFINLKEDYSQNAFAYETFISDSTEIGGWEDILDTLGVPYDSTYVVYGYSYETDSNLVQTTNFNSINKFQAIRIPLSFSYRFYIGTFIIEPTVFGCFQWLYNQNGGVYLNGEYRPFSNADPLYKKVRWEIGAGFRFQYPFSDHLYLNVYSDYRRLVGNTSTQFTQQTQNWVVGGGFRWKI